MAQTNGLLIQCDDDDDDVECEDVWWASCEVSWFLKDMNSGKWSQSSPKVDAAGDVTPLAAYFRIITAQLTILASWTNWGNLGRRAEIQVGCSLV